jgi:hypothetical protein
MRYILSDRTVDRFVKYGVNVFGIDKNLDKYDIANDGGGVGLSNAYVPLNEEDLVKILTESL